MSNEVEDGSQVTSNKIQIIHNVFEHVRHHMHVSLGSKRDLEERHIHF